MGSAERRGRAQCLRLFRYCRCARDPHSSEHHNERQMRGVGAGRTRRNGRLPAGMWGQIVGATRRGHRRLAAPGPEDLVEPGEDVVGRGDLQGAYGALSRSMVRGPMIGAVITAVQEPGQRDVGRRLAQVVWQSAP